MTQSRGGARRVLIVNPLKHTLAHYEGELLETLNQCGVSDVEIADTVAGDGVTGPFHRVTIAARTVRDRIAMAHAVHRQIVIVVWPLFGYLEPLTLLGLARSNIVYIVMHDPSPLRRSYGQSRWARGLFKALLRHRNLRILYHTAHAQRVGISNNGVEGTVVPHPMRLLPSGTDVQLRRTASRPMVRVLGQYKDTRSLTALSVLADRAAGLCEFEIHGRGWPEVAGWKVVDRFVPEHEFAFLVESSDCVVIPYDLFFQSGVAVRCLEAGVPVVAPRHEHIGELYGADWAGTVRDESDWYDALMRALAADVADLRTRRLGVMRASRLAWQELLSSGSDTADDAAH